MLVIKIREGSLFFLVWLVLAMSISKAKRDPLRTYSFGIEYPINYTGLNKLFLIGLFLACGHALPLADKVLRCERHSCL